MIHSHDSYGLGHLRRCLLIAQHLARAARHPKVLITTGSPAAGEFDLGPGVDLVRLPAAVKRDGRYHARTLDIPLDELVNLRSQIITATATAFRPDIVLIDHTPAGLAGELRPLLDRVSGWSTPPRIVLGLRDIIDSHQRTAVEWRRNGLFRLVDERIDDVLVYGDRRVGTTADELDLGSRFPGRVHHVGYVARRPSTSSGVGARPTVVVTVGGGGDGSSLVGAWADYLGSRPRTDLHTVVVLGPLMEPGDRVALAARLRRTGASVEVGAVHPDVDRLIACADAAVTMAGYNTSAEVMASGTPTLLVPRNGPRLEQRIRAERLSTTVDSISWCDPMLLDPPILGAWIDRALERGRRRPAGIDLAGADAIVHHLLSDHTRTDATDEEPNRAVPAIA